MQSIYQHEARARHKFSMLRNEPHYEESGFLPMRKQKRRSALFFATQIVLYLLLSSSESESVRTGLCQTWLEIPKTGFLAMLSLTVVHCMRVAVF